MLSSVRDSDDTRLGGSQLVPKKQHNGCLGEVRYRFNQEFAVLALDQMEAELSRAKKVTIVGMEGAYLILDDGSRILLEGAEWGADSRYTPGGVLFTRALMAAGHMTPAEAQEVSLTLPPEFTGDVPMQRNGRFA